VVTDTVTRAVTRFWYDSDGDRVLQLLPGGGRTVYGGAVDTFIADTQQVNRTYYSLNGQRIAVQTRVGGVSGGINLRLTRRCSRQPLRGCG